MTALTLDLPDEKLRRLEVVARARGTSVARLFEEMSSVMLAEADAETRFQLRAQRGAGGRRGPGGGEPRVGVDGHRAQRTRSRMTPVSARHNACWIWSAICSVTTW